MTDNTQPQQIVKSSKTKPVLFSLMILLSGIVIGAGAALIVLRQSGINEKPRLPEEFSHRMIRHLTRELHLTDEQRKQVQPVIEKHMKAMHEIRTEARPKIRQELEEMTDELMDIFDNTQQQIWKERIQRMQQRFPKMRHHRGPGDRRPNRQHPGPEGQQPRRFHEQSPGQIPPPPSEHPPLDGHEPHPPQEPNQPSPPDTVIPSL